MAGRDKKLAEEELLNGSCPVARSRRLGAEMSWGFAQALSANLCKWHQSDCRNQGTNC